MADKNNLVADHEDNADIKRLMELINGSQPQEKRKNITLGILIGLAMAFIALSIFLGLQAKINEKKYSVMAVEKINRYVAANYTNEFDDFEKADWLAKEYDYTKFYSALYSPPVAYGIYYYVPWLGNEGFGIYYNVKTGEITDGYQTEYLSGKVTFEYLDRLYCDKGNELQRRLNTQGRNDDTFAMADEIRFSASLDRQSTPAWIGVYITTPEIDYQITMEQASAERGRLSLWVKRPKAEYDDLIQLTGYLRDFILTKDIEYKTVYITVRPSYSTHIDNYNIELTKEEFESRDWLKITEEKAVTYTEKQEEADYQRKLDHIHQSEKNTAKEILSELKELFTG